jgi:hypothetical protein
VTSYVRAPGPQLRAPVVSAEIGVDGPENRGSSVLALQRWPEGGDVEQSALLRGGRYTRGAPGEPPLEDVRAGGGWSSQARAALGPMLYEPRPRTFEVRTRGDVTMDHLATLLCVADREELALAMAGDGWPTWARLDERARDSPMQP